MVFWNYRLTVTTPPGAVPHGWVGAILLQGPRLTGETEHGPDGRDGGEEGKSCAAVLQDLRALQTAKRWVPEMTFAHCSASLPTMQDMCGGSYIAMGISADAQLKLDRAPPFRPS